MDETNALSEDSLTPEGAEEDQQTTDSPTEGETSPEKGIEPPDATKNFQKALQQARERENREKERARALEEELSGFRSRLTEMELQGLDETERVRRELQIAQEERDRLKQEIEVETVKKEYRNVLSDLATDYPKTVAFLRKQAEKDVYPVQGRDRDEFDKNFAEFASEFEEATTPQVKPAASNPAYQPPAEIDYNTLSAAELGKILPRTSNE